MVSDAPEESLFAHLFFILHWNLMKRAENCQMCKISHIYFHGDALVFEFAKSKGDQDGKFVGPWHCYANPQKPHVCVVLAMAKFCLAYDGVLSKNAPLFEGISQYDRYSSIFSSFLARHSKRLSEMGVKPGDSLSEKGSCHNGCSRVYSITTYCIKCIYSCLREHNVRLNGAWGPYITHLNKEEE